MGNGESIGNAEFKEKYRKLMDTIDEMNGDDKRQVEESKSELKALVDEALHIRNIFK